MDFDCIRLDVCDLAWIALIVGLDFGVSAWVLMTLFGLLMIWHGLRLFPFGMFVIWRAFYLFFVWLGSGNSGLGVL